MDTRLLTIGEVAIQLGRSVDFVRQETDAGRLRAQPRTQAGHRRYTEAAVAAYEKRWGTKGVTPSHKYREPRSNRASQPRVERAIREALPMPEDFWEEHIDDRSVGPVPPTAAERVYINELVVAAMRDVPFDVPSESRTKLHADLESYVTIDRFPYPQSEQSAMRSIRLHVEEFVEAYRARETAREAALAAEAERRRALIAYGMQLTERAFATWEAGDPIFEARQEVRTVLDNEVKADWSEGQVRHLVDEVLAQYDPDDDDEELDEDDNDESDESRR